MGTLRDSKERLAKSPGLSARWLAPKLSVRVRTDGKVVVWWETPGKVPTVPYLPTLSSRSIHRASRLFTCQMEITARSEHTIYPLGLDPSVFKQVVRGVERCSSWAMTAPYTRDEIWMADHDSRRANPEMAPHLSSKFDGFLVSQVLLGFGCSCCLPHPSRELSGCPGCRYWCVSTWTSTASNRV
jgi:hypothetical protein